MPSFRMFASCCFLALTLLLTSGAIAHAQQDAITRYVEALISRDVATLQEVLADNYLHINANGYLQDKEHFIANLKSGNMVIDRLTYFDTIETKYGDTLVVTGNVLFKGTFKPKLPEGLQRGTIVADGEGKKEKIILYQVTPVGDRKERREAEKKAGADTKK